MIYVNAPPCFFLHNCDFSGSYAQYGVETPLTKNKKCLTNVATASKSR